MNSFHDHRERIRRLELLRVDRIRVEVGYQRCEEIGARHLGRPFDRAGGLARPWLVPGGTVNSHDIAVLGYLAVLLAGIVLQLLATRTRALPV